MDEILHLCRDAAVVAAARRRLLRELDALPDRQLADIGLDRAEIAGYVRSGRPWPASPFAARARLRVSLRGCG